jgi:hypothetical protein
MVRGGPITTAFFPWRPRHRPLVTGNAVTINAGTGDTDRRGNADIYVPTT